MKIKLKTLLLLLCWLTLHLAYGQPVDSLQTATTSQIDSTRQEVVEDDYQDIPFRAAFLFMGVIGLCFFLACIAAGAVIAIAVLAAFCGLVSLGVISTSIIVGLHEKSFEKGFKTLIVLISCIGGAGLGLIAFPLLNQVLHWTTFPVAIVIGLGID